MFLIKGKWPGMMLQNGWPELCKEYFKLCFLGLGEVPAGILTKPLGQQEGMSGSESDWDCGDAGSSVPVTPGLSLRPGISSRFWGEIFTIDLGEFSLLAVQGDAEGWGQQGQVWGPALGSQQPLQLQAGHEQLERWERPWECWGQWLGMNPGVPRGAQVCRRPRAPGLGQEW